MAMEKDATMIPAIHPAGTAATHEMRYVDWGAILGGTALALAIGIVLTTFGAALGLSIVDPKPGEGVSAQWFGIAAALWFVWVAVSSFAAGGYLSGRMRRTIGDATMQEVETRDGAHGLLVWAAGIIIGAMLAATGVGNTVSVIGSGAAAATDAVTEAATSAVENGGDTLLENAGLLPSAEVSAAVAQVLTRAAIRGEITADERSYLVRLAASGTNLSEADVNARIDAAMQQAAAAREAAVEAADKARIAALTAAFVLSATLLVSAAAAFYAAGAGGRHRDDGVGFVTASRLGSAAPSSSRGL